MLKRPLLLVLLIAMVTTAASCIFDPEKPKKEDPPVVQVYQNLNEKWHVLNNIELAYSQRKLDQVQCRTRQRFHLLLLAR